MKKINKKIVKKLALASVGTLFATELIAADDTATNSTTEVGALKEQIQELEQRMDVLEHQQQGGGGVATAPPRASALQSVPSRSARMHSGRCRSWPTLRTPARSSCQPMSGLGIVMSGSGQGTSAAQLLRCVPSPVSGPVIVPSITSPALSSTP